MKRLAEKTDRRQKTTTFQLVINSEGLTHWSISPSMLVRADEVIE
jgi:hypothetical protein